MTNGLRSRIRGSARGMRLDVAGVGRTRRATNRTRALRNLVTTARRVNLRRRVRALPTELREQVSAAYRSGLNNRRNGTAASLRGTRGFNRVVFRN